MVTLMSYSQKKYEAIKDIKIENIFFKKIGSINKGEIIDTVYYKENKSLKITHNGITGFINASEVKELESSTDTISTNTEALSSTDLDIIQLQKLIKDNRKSLNALYAFTGITVAAAVVGGATVNSDDSDISTVAFIAAGVAGLGSLISTILVLETQYKINNYNYKLQFSGTGVKVTF